MSTIKVSNIQNASTSSGGIAIDTSGHVTVDGVAYPSAGSLSGRNRIINGDMRIDQRNAGASVTPTSDIYTLDRWIAVRSQASKFSVQQNTADAPTTQGFTHCMKVTSLSAYTVTSSDYFTINQSIEGLNIADLAWGTASAKSVTLSFWVRSSLTGTFGGVFNNSGATRSYPFTYTISAANTWEQKSITIAGDTSGTWLTTNGAGIEIRFGLGVGSSQSGTAGAWSGSTFLGATGATSVVGTSGATFYITGVQLEAGTVATPFERRSYGQELALCQRYFWTNYNTGTAVGSVTLSGYIFFTRWNDAGNVSYNSVQCPVPMRTAPTVTGYSTGGVSGVWTDNASVNRTFGIVNPGTMAFTVTSAGSGANTTGQIYGHVAASSEL
jgi:hypothetical protein